MKLENMTKKQLIGEVTRLRERISELENKGQEGATGKGEQWLQSIIENSCPKYHIPMGVPDIIM